MHSFPFHDLISPRRHLSPPTKTHVYLQYPIQFYTFSSFLHTKICYLPTQKNPKCGCSFLFYLISSPKTSPKKTRPTPLGPPKSITHLRPKAHLALRPSRRPSHRVHRLRPAAPHGVWGAKDTGGRMGGWLRSDEVEGVEVWFNWGNFEGKRVFGGLGHARMGPISVYIYIYICTIVDGKKSESI